MLPAGLIAALGAAASVAAAQPAAPAPELFLPDIIATEGSEVKAAFTPDGNCVFWGSIPKTPDGHGWDILYSCLADGRWSPAQRAPFDSDANEFDPAVSPDGKTLWFFSNRPGGLGGDDIWSISFDQTTMRFGIAENAGPNINSAGAEWAPVPMDAELILFSSDGWGGEGKQDLFTGRIDGASPPQNMGPLVNSAEDDFDGAFVASSSTLVFARGDADGGKASLFAMGGDPYNETFPTPARKLPAVFNCSDELNIGPALNPADPGYLYVSAYCPSIGKGRMDIFRVPLGDLARPHPPAPSR